MCGDWKKDEYETNVWSPKKKSVIRSVVDMVIRLEVKIGGSGGGRTIKTKEWILKEKKLRGTR